MCAGDSTCTACASCCSDGVKDCDACTRESSCMPYCGPLDGDSRSVAVVTHRFQSWDDFSSGRGKKSYGGESYWCAALDYVLTRMMSYRVDFYDIQTPSVEEIRRKVDGQLRGLAEDGRPKETYHRILLDGGPTYHLGAFVEDPRDLRRLVCHVQETGIGGGRRRAFRSGRRLLSSMRATSQLVVGPCWVARGSCITGATGTGGSTFEATSSRMRIRGWLSRRLPACRTSPRVPRRFGPWGLPRCLATSKCDVLTSARARRSRFSRTRW